MRSVAQRALLAARPIIEAERDSTITGYARPENKKRKGVECLSECGYFFHVDTITERDAIADLKRLKRVLDLIDEALA